MSDPTQQSREYALPWPPSVNTNYASVRGRKILSERGRDFQKAVVEQIGKVQAMPGRLDCRMTFCGKNKTKFDVDNFAKATLDALKLAGVFNDDSQIDRLTLERGPVLPPEGVCYVSISAIEGSHDNV